MIISLHFVVFSVAITIIKIILSDAIGAMLAFYAKYSRDDYANSIRWSRIGGLLEMVTLFRNSRARVPTQSSIVISHFASTEQLMSTDPLFFWTAYMGSDNTMEVTLTSILNDTQRNPSPDLRTRYTPRTHHYDAVCKETAAYFGKDYFSGLVHPPPPMNCKCTFTLLKNGTYIWEPTAAHVHFISPNAVVVATPVYPVNASAFWLPQLEISGFERHPCVRNFRPSLDTLLMYFPKDGIINLPRTDTTKCQYSSDESIVLSTTYIDFAVNNPTTLTASFGPKEDMKKGLLSTYMAATMISVKPQPWDPAMAGHLNRTSASPINADLPISRLDLNVYHLPQASASKKTTTSFSTAHLLQATADATEHLASLGHNVFLEDAFEVATVSLVVLLVVVVVCTVAWAISEVFYSAAYTGRCNIHRIGPMPNSNGLIAYFSTATPSTNTDSIATLRAEMPHMPSQDTEPSTRPEFRRPVEPQQGTDFKFFLLLLYMQANDKRHQGSTPIQHPFRQ
ncbi:MAG: hypothetical protein J3R72DRAFT_490759 [Linnemannia gamsii]|nr:MAG: hypothetical protein J3R72DRAFT_490759 [Linnemannia gamsii]